MSESRGSVWLDARGASIDVVDFDRAVREESADPEQRIAALRRAVELHCGPLLQGWETEMEWVRNEQARRREACFEALRALADEALNGNVHARPGEAALCLEHYVAARPSELRGWSA